jgi:hypothetical protein
MPKAYEGMRDAFKKKGMPEGKAKTKAARIYNAGRPKGAKPVTNKKSAGRKR